MPSEVRQKNYEKIGYGQKMLNFGASKPGVKGEPGLPGHPHWSASA